MKKFKIGKVQKRTTKERKKKHLTWGPYLSDRQWGTVREDRTGNNESWQSLNFYESGKTSYMCGEDGIFGICDQDCRLCFAYCLYNGMDERVKEKLFGLSGPQGNHGEDVKEVYFYRTNTPSHDYMTADYMYPMKPFPYEELESVNSNRGLSEDEYELCNTDCFINGWWHIKVTYTKRNNGEIVSVVEAKNCSRFKRSLSVIPTIWFRNTWSSLYPSTNCSPNIRILSSNLVCCQHNDLGSVYMSIKSPTVYFKLTENDSSLSTEDADPKSYQQTSNSHGTKCYAVVPVTVDPGDSIELQTHIFQHHSDLKAMSKTIRTSTGLQRAAERFYDDTLSWLPSNLPEIRKILQMSLSGLLWNKQYYEYDVHKSNKVRKEKFGEGAVWNKNWEQFNIKAVLSMPDKWEFPWFASWDLCLQMIPFSEIDPLFAQNQIEILLSPSFMRSDGQLPGCEYNFDDPNPPLQGFAVLHIFKKTQDWAFLRKVFPRLHLSLLWWWNRRKYLNGRSDEFNDGLYFTGGFLGLDNISVINRSNVPEGFQLFQCDAFSWIYLLTLNCLEVALLLHKRNQGFVDFSHLEELVQMLAEMQHKFRHFHDGIGCDLLLCPDGTIQILKIKSYVAMSPLLASQSLKTTSLLQHLLKAQPSLLYEINKSVMRVSLLTVDQTKELVNTLCNHTGFLGLFRIRSLSKEYQDTPYEIEIDGVQYHLKYCPGESNSKMFGGNSNWRGPVWIPMNFLLIDALRNIARNSSEIQSCVMYDSEMSIERLWRVISNRILDIFLRDVNGRRPVHDDCPMFIKDGSWSGPEFVLFYEYFHGDTGRGCGASHQTGWTSLITNIVKFLYCDSPT